MAGVPGGLLDQVYVDPAQRHPAEPGHRSRVVERRVDVGEVQVLGENPYPVDDPLDNVGFVFFSDPDGNSWAVQQISSRG